MVIVSLNVSELVSVEYQGRTISTGIFKKPVTERLKVNFTGLESDDQADKQAHGGADKALYAYSVDNYPYWQSQLDLSEMPFGTFGENLSVESLTDDVVHIGDVFKIGNLIAQVSQPRVPCYKLGIRMDSTTFPKLFMKSGRVGFYLRVLEEAVIGVGDRIEKLNEDPNRLSIEQSMLALYKGPKQKQIIERALKIDALSEAWRLDLSNRQKKFDNHVAGNAFYE